MAVKKKKHNFFSRLVTLFITLIAIAMILVPSSLAVVIYYNSPVQDAGESAVPAELDGIKKGENGDYYIEVRKGESAQSVGLRLERAGLIRNRHFWYLLCRYKKDFIKSGTYQLQIPASQMSIHQILVSGRQLLHKVTVPEGVTLKKTAQILEEAGICSAQDFLEAAGSPDILSRYRIPNATMEGYLFPDTYLFPSEYPAINVLKSMVDTFFTRIEMLDPDVLARSPQELNEKVIIASIVEREYRLREEAPLMAGVFYNRLNIGMALQSCATVEYIITEIQGRPHPLVLYNRDIEIRNPYNTYIIPGLPPGPISAPGFTALEAAFFPAEVDFLYFRLNDPESGRHYFSKTFDEHIRAGELVLKSRP
ncbi:MAG: endolytic transglycosylase MltG [Treponema sp.]|nr:endolytic transglycosylase MltG [Treponema sp.]